MTTTTDTSKYPSYSSITIEQAVNAALGKDRTKPDIVYKFGEREFVEYQDVNPYTGGS